MPEALKMKRFMHVTAGRKENTFCGTGMHFDPATKLVSIYVEDLVVVYLNLAPGESIHEMVEGEL